MPSGFGESLKQVITDMGVAAGEIDNVMEAAMRDIGENVVQTLAGSWPLGERRIPSQEGIHSADLWELEQTQKLTFNIKNTADYASFVHGESKFGGPPGLADRVVPDLIEQVSEEPLAFVTQRVFDLLGGP